METQYEVFVMFCFTGKIIADIIIMVSTLILLTIMLVMIFLASHA